MTTLTFADALSADPNTVLSVEAPAGDIDGIEAFVHLKSLTLSGNQTVVDFSFLQKLEELEELYLEDLGLIQIPNEVTALKKLKTLFIGKNSIASFELLKELPSLVDLGLEDLGLRKVPDDVLALKQLKVLGLTGNSIGSLAPLKSLTNLESLYAGNNNIKKVPKELAKLKKLTFLDLMGSASLKECEALADLLALETLSISNGYELQSYPDGLFKLPNLKSLEVSLHAKTPPDGFRGFATHALVNLEELTITNSSLTALPDSISAMKKLKTVRFERNSELTNIDALRDLPELKTAKLNSNKIERVGEGFSTLKKLETVELSHNSLSDISGLRDLPELRELRLFTKLRELPRTLGSFPKLELLHVSGKRGDLSCLGDLGSLAELYVACEFDALPASLGKTLKKLTVFRNAGTDRYLEAFTSLEELQVTQPSFTLPPMPSLKTLSVGGGETEINLEELTAATALERFRLHRNDMIEALPSALSTATQLRHIHLEFFDELSDVSALGPLEGLETLRIDYCESLTTLDGLGSKPKLTELHLYSVGCADIDAIAGWTALTCLSLNRLEALTSLPDELATFPNLSEVRLKDLEELKDISVLERCEALARFQSSGYGPSRQAMAKVMTAIDNRRGETAALKTSYATFMKSMYKKLEGKEDASNTYGFPLYFDTAENLLEAIDDFSWLDDYRYDEESEWGEILTNPDHGIKPLAILDWGYEGCDTDGIDAYSEEIFLVDTESPMNPVLLWGHDSQPTEIHKSFDAFLAKLQDFVVETEA